MVRKSASKGAESGFKIQSRTTLITTSSDWWHRRTSGESSHTPPSPLAGEVSFCCFVRTTSGCPLSPSSLLRHVLLADGLCAGQRNFLISSVTRWRTHRYFVVVFVRLLLLRQMDYGTTCCMYINKNIVEVFIRCYLPLRLTAVFNESGRVK